MSQVSGKGELLCEHKGSGLSAFAHGLCKSCYRDVILLALTTFIILNMKIHPSAYTFVFCLSVSFSVHATLRGP